MTWEHTPSQGAGLGFLVSFIQTTPHLTACIHSPYHTGHYSKDFTFAANLKKKKKQKQLHVLFSHTLPWLQTHKTELTVMAMQHFLPLHHKISLSRAQEATCNILNHL